MFSKRVISSIHLKETGPTWYMYNHFLKGDIFYEFLFAFLKIEPLPKGVYSKRKEFTSNGSKFFLYRIDLFSEGRQKSLTELSHLTVNPFPFTHCSRETHKRVIGKQCRPRSDAAEWGI